MTVKELSEQIECRVISMPDGEREITGAYIGDLLSWVMGRAKADCAWITIMSNVNTVAVATLADVSCIILAEGVTLEGDVAAVAAQKGVNVISTEMAAYEIAVRLSGIIR